MQNGLARQERVGAQRQLAASAAALTEADHAPDHAPAPRRFPFSAWAGAWRRASRLGPAHPEELVPQQRRCRGALRGALVEALRDHVRHVLAERRGAGTGGASGFPKGVRQRERRAVEDAAQQTQRVQARVRMVAVGEPGGGARARVRRRRAKMSGRVEGRPLLAQAARPAEEPHALPQRRWQPASTLAGAAPGPRSL
jgi:hypothetical protein